MADNNLDLDSDFSYEKFGEAGAETALPIILPVGTIFVSTVNGASGSITFSGGTTGLTFGAAGATVTLSGALVVANGGTGATTAAGARTNLGAAASGVNTDITQLNGASQVDVSTEYRKSGTKVVGARNTGWTAWTGTGTKTSFDTATATLTNANEAIKAILDALIAHGLIGA